jgi:stage II sporulation protein D
MVVAAVLLVAASAPVQDLAPPQPELLRVLLNGIGTATKITLSADAGVELLSPGMEGPVVATGPGEPVTIRLEGTKLRVGSRQFDQVLALSRARTTTVTADATRTYRGRIRLLPGRQRVVVINEVGLEAYLMGVVPAEVPASFHPEALKAQAVAARTFALAKLLRSAGEAFDLDDTTASQTYLGAGAERPQTNTAIRETSNQVLLVDGSPIEALYCTVSGGFTASNDEAFDSAPLPYLRSVRDTDELGTPFGAWSPHYSWEFLLREYPGVGTVRSVEIVSRTGSGRVANVRITGERGSLMVSGAAFRNAVGVNNLKSLLIDSVVATEKGVRIRGRGWGHGVGMCQAGAQGRALGGQTYDRILATYYSGARLVFVPDPVVYTRGLATKSLRP